MLKALYDYAVRKHLSPPPGYAPKTIKAWISLSSDSDYIGIVSGDSTEILCPDIGSLANGTTKSNVLTEKRSVLFPDEKSLKTDFFMKTMREAVKADLVWRRALDALEDSEKRKIILEELDRAKVKPGDRLSFLIDGKPAVSSDKTVSWWQEYRRQFSGGTSPDTLCMITGESAIPMTTTPPIQGLHAVGGHARGDALISFDKASFTSYGLKQAANAPVSEEAYSAVKAALDDLLKEAPILAGMKFVHWYDRDMPAGTDLIKEAVVGSDQSEGNAPFDDDDYGDGEVQVTVVPVNEEAERRRADSVPASVRLGTEADDLDGTPYYILLLSGVGGRVMVRRFERGNYADLRKNISRWYRELELINSAGTGPRKETKLAGRLMRLLKYQKVDKEPYRRLEKELAGVTPSVIESILNGTPLPDNVAARALAYIRSRMLAEEDNSEGKARSMRIPDGIACQWLKVWLLRRSEEEKEETKLMSEYNENHPNPAYHCGAVMAIYAAIQQTAMPDVGAGVVQRYYASAMQTPALVFGQLSKLSNYHLDKIENKYVAGLYREKLANAWKAVGNTVPAVLNLEQQSYFTLGYYQMAALLNREKAEKIAEWKQRNENQQQKLTEEAE